MGWLPASALGIGDGPRELSFSQEEEVAAGRAVIRSATGNVDIGVQPAAYSLPHRPSLQLVCRLGTDMQKAGRGGAGPEGEITAVHTGDLSCDERCCTSVTVAQLLLPRLAHTVLPSHTHRPCTTAAYMVGPLSAGPLPRGPLPLTPSS